MYERIYIRTNTEYRGGYIMVKRNIDVSILKSVEKYIRDFVKTNSIDFDCFEEAQEVKEKVNKKTKLQDALIVLNKINGPMDLVFIIKDRLKRFK